MINRNILELLNKSKKSILLIGPRQTGKSTLIRSLNPDLSINLMNESVFFEFSKNPGELESRLKANKPKSIFIDEIQRLPSLLNTIQTIIDENPHLYKFYMTGSNARKLRRGSANLLPGRIHAFQLDGLVASELNYEMDEEKALAYGTLPGIYTETDDSTNKRTLETYAATYLREEIQAEGLTKNIEGFSRFLSIAATESSKYLDLTKLASESGVPRQTAGRFFEILEDTLVVRRCDSFASSQRKRLIQHPRFFFFDTGALNGLMKNFILSPDRVGPLFETLLFNQISASAASIGNDIRISSYRTSSGSEVDFIIEYKGEIFAIEAKASKNVGPADLRSLIGFQTYLGKKKCRLLVAYLGIHKKEIAGVEIWPWQKLLKEIGL